MHDTNTPSDDLRPEVTATGGGGQQATSIPEEHQPFADAILATDPMDVPRTHNIPEGWGASPLGLRSSALPPDMAREVENRLHALGNITPEERAAKEAEFTAAAVRGKRSELITKIGVGDNATPYHREMADIAREVQDLERELGRLDDELARVARYDMVHDAETGESKPSPVYAVTGERARAYTAQQEDLERRIRLLVQPDGNLGLIGAKRARQALAVSAAAQHEKASQLAEEAEARRLAAKLGRERRINARAESLDRLSQNAS